MNLVLKRSYFSDATLGHLFIRGEDNPVWYTIENPDLDNKRNVSCIPEGTYEVKPYSSDKFPDVWELQNVEGRDNILIHIGNWTSDTDGCILVGLGSGYLHNRGVNQKAIYNSRQAINQLKQHLNYPCNFTLEIRS